MSNWFSYLNMFSYITCKLILLHVNFLCYYCSIVLKRQSEHSGFRIDTSSLFHFIFHFQRNCLPFILRVQRHLLFRANFYPKWANQTGIQNHNFNQKNCPKEKNQVRAEFLLSFTRYNFFL